MELQTLIEKFEKFSIFNRLWSEIWSEKKFNLKDIIDYQIRGKKYLNLFDTELENSKNFKPYTYLPFAFINDIYLIKIYQKYSQKKEFKTSLKYNFLTLDMLLYNAHVVNLGLGYEQSNQPNFWVIGNEVTMSIPIRTSSSTILCWKFIVNPESINLTETPYGKIFPIFTKSFPSKHYIDTKIHELFDIQPAKTTDSQITMKVELSSSDIDKSELFDNFISHFQSDILVVSRKTRDISLNNIVYIETITKETVPNPDYLIWKHKKEQLQLLLEDSPDDEETKKDEKKPLNPLLLSHIRVVPPETIEIEKLTKHIDSKLVKKTSKSLNTLYLRKSDKMRLLNILENFKSKSSLYTELEIPYKLNILLHGRPGTGKSTTIRAIATYLERDIYFVNLKTIKTNRELSNVFDYIKKTCGKGIIIFEDIDCMSNIVLDRDTLREPLEKTMTEILETTDDSLSLSYLLNMLDGSLSSDGSVFIMTTNYRERLDKALIRKGRVDVNLEMKCCDRYMIASIFRDIVKKEISSELLESIADDVFTPSDVIFHIVDNYYNITNEYELMEPFIIRSEGASESKTFD